MPIVKILEEIDSDKGACEIGKNPYPQSIIGREQRNDDISGNRMHHKQECRQGSQVHETLFQIAGPENDQRECNEEYNRKQMNKQPQILTAVTDNEKSASYDSYRQ